MTHYNLAVVYLSLSTKNTSSPDPGHSVGAKYLQTVQNCEKLPTLCFFLLETLHKCLKSCVLCCHHGNTYCHFIYTLGQKVAFGLLI